MRARRARARVARTVRCGLCKKYFACSTLADPKDFRQHMTRAHHPELVSVLDGAVSFDDMDDPADYTRAKKQLSADECRSSYCLAPKPAGVPAKFRKQVAASVRAFVPP